MAMSKAERAEFESMKAERDKALAQVKIVEALRWPEGPAPVRSIRSAEKMVTGWDFNVHRFISSSARAVFKAWSYATSHGEGEYTPLSTGCQGGCDLYPTRAQALRALRLDYVKMVANRLAELDSEIEREESLK